MEEAEALCVVSEQLSSKHAGMHARCKARSWRQRLIDQDDSTPQSASCLGLQLLTLRLVWRQGLTKPKN